LAGIFELSHYGRTTPAGDTDMIEKRTIGIVGAG
jgi:hypothetical protein